MLILNKKTSKLDLKNVLSRNVILIMLIHFTQQCGAAMVNSVQGQLGKSLGLSATVIGVAATLYTFVGIFCRSPGSSLVEKFDLKKALVALFSLRVLASVIQAFASTTVLYVLARVLTGIGWSMAGVALAAAMGILVDKRLLGTFYSLYLALSFFGRNLFRPIAINMFAEHGTFLPSIIAAGLFAICILLALLFDSNDEKLTMVKTAALEKAAGKKKTFNPFAGINVLAIPLCAVVATAIATFKVEDLYTPIMCEEIGIDMTTALAVAAVITSVAMFTFGVLCDVINPKIITVVTLACTAVGTIMMARAQNQTDFLIYYTLYAIGNRWDIPFLMMLLKKAGKAAYPSLTATLLIFQDIWSAISTTVFGFIVERAGYQMTYLLAGLLPVIGIVVILTVSNPVLEKIQKTYITEESAKAV